MHGLTAHNYKQLPEIPMLYYEPGPQRELHIWIQVMLTVSWWGR